MQSIEICINHKKFFGNNRNYFLKDDNELQLYFHKGPHRKSYFRENLSCNELRTKQY